MNNNKIKVIKYLRKTKSILLVIKISKFNDFLNIYIDEDIWALTKIIRLHERYVLFYFWMVEQHNI